MSTFKQAAIENPRLVAQLAYLFEVEADALELEARRLSNVIPRDVRAEAVRLYDIAAEFDDAASGAGYVGYPFGDEV